MSSEHFISIDPNEGKEKKSSCNTEELIRTVINRGIKDTNGIEKIIKESNEVGKKSCDAREILRGAINRGLKQ